MAAPIIVHVHEYCRVHQMNKPPGDIAHNFLSKLSGVRQTGSGWQAQCPCRDDDRNPSLSIGEGQDGKVLVTCHRGGGCNVEQICFAVGMKVSDLMPPSIDFVKPKDKPTLVKTYDFVDENGVLLFQKLRYLNSDGTKTFKQRKPGPTHGEWVYSLGDTPKVLYNLPAVLAARASGTPIWVVEGEKDADTLTALGFCATTMPGGAGKWLDIHTAALAGAVVDIISDNDLPGRGHALKVLAALTGAGCDAQVWVSETHKDITDHLSAGKTIDNLIALEELPEIFPQSDHTPIADAPRPGTDDAKDALLARVQQILDRDDLDTNLKIAKASLILSSSPSTNVLDPGRLVQWNDLFNEEFDDSYDWVIPGLLERGERVIVVAVEGLGKSMLARQMAILPSAGLHPFTYMPMRPVRTLLIDLENPERIIRRTSRNIEIQAMRRGNVARLDGHILVKPSGLNLMTASDRALLEDAVERTKPEILLIGPLYKAFIDPGGRTSESIAVEIAKYLDTIRIGFNCALWIEAHAPLGSSMTSRDLRPFGSAVWSRWPEFGISLQPDPTTNDPFVYDVKHFRGARDERQWPTKIRRGKVFPFEAMEFAKIGP